MSKIFWWRFFSLVGVALIQFSWVNLVFPSSPVPGLVFNIVIAIVLVRGFREGMVEWLTLLFLYDILRGSAPSLLLPVGIFLAYLTSFLSRRFIFERRGMGALLLAFLSTFFAVFFTVFLAFLNDTSIQRSTLMLDTLLIFLTFFPLFSLVQWFEARLETLSRSEFRGLRH